MVDIKEMQKGHKARLQQRYQNESLEAFEAYEVLEMILSMTIIRKDTKPIAKKLLKIYGSLNGVMSTPIEDLLSNDSIGLKTATNIKLFKDVNVYLLREKVIKTNVFKSVNDVENYLLSRYKGCKTEEFRVLYLNSKNVLLKDAAISTGTSSKTYVDFTLMAKHIIDIGATAIIVLHNHPSGSITPSEQDIKTTQNLKKFLTYLSVRLLDHFIIGSNEILSFADEGLI